ncbi:hypothetical protein PR202_ga07146 [Eleusine coracana subsp. coracana]|uniref:Uncharacterized protein n=1 Tax=Eleusine coracana subsp. coracana TaxID=191504 RepID=A0AAV5BZ66_ELECO|nr:hypothetical protein PR202_ga07146 [Eleusine coracana subsp. coracana]
MFKRDGMDQIKEGKNLSSLTHVEPKNLYIVYMGEKQHDDPSVVTASHHDVLTSILGSKDEAQKCIVYSYKHGFSGFGTGLPGVVSVMLNTHHKTHTTRSWDFLGLDHYQSSRSSNLLKKAKYGEDIIVGVVDSGIWPESRSFEDRGYGPVPARWKGTCQTGQAFNATSCNRKIIGTRWYTGGVRPDILEQDYMSPRDVDGHGTHVASTIVGSEVRNASFGGLGGGVARGGAPRARLAVYKVCWGSGQNGTCSTAAILAAIDDAINDGVDVLSLSLGSSNEIPGTLHAVAKGITVVFAGSNDGPAANTVLNAVPWVLTVAASTIDRAFPTMISLGNKEKIVGQSLYHNATLDSSEYYPLFVSFKCDKKSLASTNLTGMVVLCYAPWEASSKLPAQGFVNAVTVIAKSGARGLIFAQHNSNDAINNLIVDCDGIMACVLVDFEMAYRIQSTGVCTELMIVVNLNSRVCTTKSMVRISPAMTVVGNGVLSPRVAAFSPRGPSPAYPGILKPDIAAPGVGILAAIRNSYEFKSGTSMACPHVSAIAALLKSAHPDWSPAMIKSAIVTSASVTDRFGMPIQAEGSPRKLADPFDFGGGHVNPDKAADPGLVYDVDARDFTKFFNCTLGAQDDCKDYNGKLYQLNLPSIAVSDLKGSITVSRTVTNVGPPDATYRVVVEAPAGVDMSVEPSVIRFNGGRKTAKYQVTFRAKQWVQGGYTFGSLTWLDDNTHSVRIPVAIRTVIEDFISDTS